MRRRALALLLASALGVVAAMPADIQFNRDVRPILSDNCFVCHGADKGSRKAKLRLDLREVAIEKGAIVPGKPDESEIVKRIFTANEDDLMPPSDSHKKLTENQKETLKNWITAGAKYEPHWSFITPVRPAIPERAGKPKPTNPVDAFVLAELDEKKVEPSKEANRRTLLRRLSLDLTGLPPTPAEISAFENDSTKDAYARQVDRLLASPHYGERMAVPWLDVVRFADTVGYHGDQNVNVFPYRDYVIDAFNSNKRFDQFTTEQLAGDLLPDATSKQRIATGFNRLNMMTREGGAQPKEYLAKYGADRVRAVGMAWLGLTVGCAECHDHKFDPFSTKDFYQLKAFFADVRQWGVYSDYKYTPNPDLKGWDNEHPFPPEEIVESPYLKQRLARLRAEVNELSGAAGEKNSDAFKTWKETLPEVFEKTRHGWMTPPAVTTLVTNIGVITNRSSFTNVIAATDTSSAITNITNIVTFQTNVTIAENFVAQPDGSLLFPGKPDGTPVLLRLEAGTVATLRIELMPHHKHKDSIFRGAGDTVQLSAFLSRQGKEKESRLSFYFADADLKEPRYANGHEIIGIKDAWKISRQRATNTVAGVWLLDPPLTARAGDVLVIRFKTNNVARVRVALSPFATENPLKSWPAQEPGAFSSALSWLLSTGADTNAFSQFKALHRDIQECREGNAPTVVTVAWQPETTRVLPRGNWLSDDGEVVEPLAPAFLPQPKRAGTNRLTRLDLARWLVSAENPLTARTIVNRLWKQFFGAGLANPVDDLGLQGEPPSHPELLDWLAVEFRDSGWDVKHIVRLIVTSSTYRQAAESRPELRELDPNNRLLATHNPRRLEAEFVRDNALAIAGLLNRDTGGPSVHPYQPAGYYANLQFPDRDYYASKDERQYRRGLYAHWQRTFLQPMLANFDAPSREECTAIRTVSNTPQQALTLLNDPTFVEAARVWAMKLLRKPKLSDEERLDLAFQLAIGRPIKRTERASLTTFLTNQREHLKDDRDEALKLQKVGIAPIGENLDAVELGAWTGVCRVILNLHETITLY